MYNSERINRLGIDPNFTVKEKLNGISAQETDLTSSVTNESLIIPLAVCIPLLLWIIFLCCWKRETLERFFQRISQQQQPIYQNDLSGMQTNLGHARRAEYQVFESEFRVISQMETDKSCNAGKDPINASKNRFRDVIPYDFNRIKLVNGKNGDYINASKVSEMFIATQDPLPDQDEDFWTMLWDNNVTIIIRLSADSVEAPIARYLPDIANNAWVFGVQEIRVINVTMHHLGQIKVTKLQVEKGKTKRYMIHFHLTSWRVGSTPTNDEMLQLLATARKTWQSIGGMVAVHCGAGAGRTGTLIALWLLIDSLSDGSEPDVSSMVAALRFQRFGMVQTSDQYVFIHKCLKRYQSEAHKWPGVDVL